MMKKTCWDKDRNGTVGCLVIFMFLNHQMEKSDALISSTHVPLQSCASPYIGLQHCACSCFIWSLPSTASVFSMQNAQVCKVAQLGRKCGAKWLSCHVPFPSTNILGIKLLFSSQIKIATDESSAEWSGTKRSSTEILGLFVNSRGKTCSNVL